MTAGGTVVGPVRRHGRRAYAVFRTSGAFFSAWQPGTNVGCEVVNEPGVLLERAQPR